MGDNSTRPGNRRFSLTKSAAGVIALLASVATILGFLITLNQFWHHPNVPATPPPTSTSVACSVPPTWQSALDESLRQNGSISWDVGPDPNQKGTNIQFNDAGYHLSAPANETIQGLAHTTDTFSTFYYQATMTINSGTTDPNGGAGLIFRSDSMGSDYFYSFDVQGNWTLELYQVDASMLTTLAYGASAAFVQGYSHANVLGVDAIGDTFTLCINGQDITPTPKVNGAISMGLIGVEVDAGISQDADAVFSNAKVWTPA